jgi:tetratricopeptide (TPR) repeat protein
MRAYVFTDSSLARHAGRFVWLEIDGEKAKNAALRKRLKVPGYPTFYVVEPASERVALRWVGSATLPQLHALLDEGLGAAAGGGSGLPALLARADSLYAAGEDSSASLAYQETLAAAPPGWPPYARAVESALFALSRSGGQPRCIELAREALGRLKGTPSGANVAASGLSCALALEPGSPGRAEAIAFFEAAAREAILDPGLPLTADDRSSIYPLLVEAREDAKDAGGRTRALQEWAAMLERAAAQARTPEQRAVFDSHRLGVYLELGQPERAVPMLEASERDLPADYNPPARLAVAYHALKRYDLALAASDRALAKSYGPRRMRIFNNRLDVLIAQGDSAAARRTLERAIREGEAMPEGQRPDGSLAAFKKRLAAMSGGAAADAP